MAPQKAQHKQKATVQSESSGSDDSNDFDDYEQWVRRADKDTQETVVRQDWDELSKTIAVAFADAVRAFEVGEGVHSGTEDELQKELRRVAIFKPSEERSERRKVSAEAANLYKALVGTLGVWTLAIEAVLEQLDVMDAVLTTMPKEKLQPLLETYQHKLRKLIETAQKRNGDWIEVFHQLAPERQWTLGDVKKL